MYISHTVAKGHIYDIATNCLLINPMFILFLVGCKPLGDWYPMHGVYCSLDGYYANDSFTVKGVGQVLCVFSFICRLDC